MINLGGPAIAMQRGREVSLERGDAIALAGSDRGSFTTTRAGRLITLECPNGALIPLLRDPHQLAITHMYDLAAMALDAAREAAEIADRRGVRAARLRAIKSDILARADREMSVEALAARHGVSARYVRMLSERDGTNVTDFVREERLKSARMMLLSPRFAALKIAEVAFRVGFDDLSYSNRTFRRRFGRTPREVREGS